MAQRLCSVHSSILVIDKESEGEGLGLGHTHTLAAGTHDAAATRQQKRLLFAFPSDMQAGSQRRIKDRDS